MTCLPKAFPVFFFAFFIQFTLLVFGVRFVNNFIPCLVLLCVHLCPNLPLSMAPHRWYFAWENIQWGFSDVSCCSSSWIFILLLYLHLSMFFILLLFFHSHFLFNVIPHPSVDYLRGFYTPFYTFSPTHCRMIRDIFIFWPFRYLLAASATALSGHFFTHRCFLSYTPSLTS